MMYKWEVPAMTAVIYARYSSDNQREESIEGQIRECTAYAEKNGITIVKHYIDRAISAKTDNRPEFQQMIKDSDKKLFDIVLVWKLDRFARNRYDSARYKTQLKKNGVKLMSATPSPSPSTLSQSRRIVSRLSSSMSSATSSQPVMAPTSMHGWRPICRTTKKGADCFPACRGNWYRGWQLVTSD